LCRGSLAWFGRQTHNLENNGGQTPDVQRSRARIPPPALLNLELGFFIQIAFFDQISALESLHKDKLGFKLKRL
jgi:hypothetical protein